MALPDFTMRQLLEAGSHFGHQAHRWNPKMQSYIFGTRNNIHIIDLAQTVPALAQALQAVSDTPHALVALSNPTLPKSKKIELFTQLLPPPPHPLIINLAKTLAMNSRLGLVCEVIRAYLMIQAMHDGALPLKIVTAAPLEEDAQNTLLAALQKIFDAPLMPSYAVTPEILGGVKIYLGSYLVDDSWSHRLKTMMHHLATEWHL